jgi:hypothetical protein
MKKFQIVGSLVEQTIWGKDFRMLSKYDGTLNSIKGIEWLAVGGVHVTYLGGGWWRVAWSAYDHRDLNAWKLKLL